MKKTIRISDDEFISRFAPHVDESGAIIPHSAPPVDAQPLHVWTMLDCDGSLIIASGIHYVNRDHYIVTANPAPSDESVEVAWIMQGTLGNSYWGAACPKCDTDLSPTNPPPSLSESAPIQCSCGHEFSWDDGRSHRARLENDSRDMATADFLFSDADWVDAVVRCHTRLGRDEWKLHMMSERSQGDHSSNS